MAVANFGRRRMMNRYSRACIWVLFGIASQFHLGCVSEEPVPEGPEDIICRLSGHVYHHDGTVASNVDIHVDLVERSFLPVFWTVGAIINEDGEPFQECLTDDEGYFEMSFGLDEVKLPKLPWVPHLALWAIDPTDPTGERAFATESLSCTVEEPEIYLTDLMFWELDDDSVQLAEDHVHFSWDDSPRLPGPDHQYMLHVEGTEWIVELNGNDYDLPFTALEPCKAPVVDPEDVCEPASERRVRLVSLTDGMRYRTSWKEFSAVNPKGKGYSFVDPTPWSWGSFPHDGVHSDDNSDGWFQRGSGPLLLDLGESIVLKEIYIHNGGLWRHEDVLVEISISLNEEPLFSGWELIETVDLRGNDFWNVSIRVPDINTSARWIRFDPDNQTVMGSHWHKMGEVTIYTE